MQKNELLRKDGNIVRILAAEGDAVLYISCKGISSPMPKWCRASEFEDYSPCSEDELQADAYPSFNQFRYWYAKTRII